MAKKPQLKTEPPAERVIEGLQDALDGNVTVVHTPEPAENWPDADLIREIRVKTRDFSVFEAEYPSIALAAAHIGPVLGLGPINTAEAILLWQHWIGRE